MNLMTALEISATGLSAERTRLNVASMNLANAHVTRTMDGGPYRAKSVIFSARPYQDKGQGIHESFSNHLARETSGLQVVEVDGIVDDQGPFNETYDPAHPDADSRGIVRLPNVNVMEQMVDIMTAARAYEANVTAMSTAKAMAMKALEIAR